MSKLQIDKPIRLIELFAGIGSQAMALRDIGADFESWRAVDFDKYSIRSYNAIHGTNYEPIDITTLHGADLGIIDTDKFTYLLTYSFPCQDLSVAGAQKGMSDTNTRSGLVWEVGRLLSECEEKPQILVMENVTQVHGKKFVKDFERWLDVLKGLGYTSVYADLLATDFGVAQSRKRCFCVSWLGDYEYTFPTGCGLGDKVVMDYLEENPSADVFVQSERARDLIEEMIINGTIAEELDSQRERSQNRCTHKTKSFSKHLHHVGKQV